MFTSFSTHGKLAHHQANRFLHIRAPIVEIVTITMANSCSTNKFDLTPSCLCLFEVQIHYGYVFFLFLDRLLLFKNVFRGTLYEFCSSTILPCPFFNFFCLPMTRDFDLQTTRSDEKLRRSFSVEFRILFIAHWEGHFSKFGCILNQNRFSMIWIFYFLQVWQCQKKKNLISLHYEKIIIMSSSRFYANGYTCGFLFVIFFGTVLMIAEQNWT